MAQHTSSMLLLLVCGLLGAAVVQGAMPGALHARTLLQTEPQVPVVAPDGTPMAAESYDAYGRYPPNFLAELNAALANVAKLYNLKTTTPNDKAAVVAAVRALDGNAAPGPFAAALDKAVKSLIAAAQANALADAAAAINKKAENEVNSDVEPLGKAVNKLVVAQPAKSAGIFALSSLLISAPGGYTMSVAPQLAKTWEFAGADQATVNALAQASAGAAIAGGKVAAREWGKALGAHLGTATGAKEDAYARAAASVLCKGGASSGAWASVYSVALNPSGDVAPGCKVLSKAMGLVKAQKCTVGDSKGLSALLSFCKIKA